MFHNKRSYGIEKPTHCNREQSPLTATGEKPMQQRCPSTAKKHNKFKKKKKDIKHKEQWEGIHIRKEKEETEVAGVRV